MANIRKTFNFRNGVQVDEDNFIVDSLGKVGIGTTVPNEFLDVRGDTKVVGIITSQSIETRNVNVAGVTTFSGNTHVGNGITMYPTSGIVSATGFYGDASKLSNLPTSQWINVAGAGLTSIYNQGFVGVCTNNPKFTFQVGGNDSLSTFLNGVGINSSGGIVATGVITATKFVGDVEGAVSGGITGDISGNVNATSVGSTSLNVTGISTFKDDVEFHGATGITSAFWDKSANALTIKDNAKASFGDTAGDFDIYYDNNAYLTTGSRGFIINSYNGSFAINGGSNSDFKFGVTFLGTISAGDLMGGSTNTYDLGIASIKWRDLYLCGAVQGNVNAGIVTATTRSEVAKQGIGTASPQSQLHVFNHSGISSIQVESGSSEAIISLGKFANQQQTSAEIVFGKTTGGLNYSNTASLDIINYDNGNVNNIIDLGSGSGTNAVRGHWNWMSGSDINNPRMTLTNDGNLGIGKTNPVRALDVVGIATVSNDSFVGANSWIAGNATVYGNLNVTGSTNVNIAGQNLNVTTGHSKVKNLDVTNALNVTGITTFNDNVGIAGTVGSGQWFFINADGHVAIGTATLMNAPSVGLDARQVQVTARGLGVGRTELTAAVDFSNAGRAHDDVVVPTAEAGRMYMYPPKVSGDERDNDLVGLTGGAIVYNTDNNSLQVYNGSSWSNQAAGGVTTLNGLSDVTISGSPSTGQFLKYTGSGWENATGTIGTLNDLSGVTISSPSNDQVLKYNGSAWVNASSPGGLADIVSDTTPQLGGNLDTNSKNITFGDSSGATVNRLTLGAAPDMSIYHDGTSGSINLANGSLTTRVHDSNGKGFYIEDPNGGSAETIAKFEKDATTGKGRCELLFEGSKKFETTSTGVTITGDLTVTGSGGLKSRSTVTGTASNLASGSSADVNITGAYKSYALLKIAINRPAWVVLYTNDTTRTADDSRSSSTDPTPGSGVLAEVITTASGSSTFVMTPGVIGWNDDGTPTTTVYAKVQNLDSVSRSITITLTLLPLE